MRDCVVERKISLPQVLTTARVSIVRTVKTQNTSMLIGIHVEDFLEFAPSDVSKMLLKYVSVSAEFFHIIFSVKVVAGLCHNNFLSAQYFKVRLYRFVAIPSSNSPLRTPVSQKQTCRLSTIKSIFDLHVESTSVRSSGT